MPTSRVQLTQRVALRMDEITPDSALSGINVDGNDNNPLYALIDGIIDDGVMELFTVAPYWRLKQQEFAGIDVAALPSKLGDHSSDGNGGATTIATRYVIRLKVPDDFLRVAEIDCPDHFARPVTEVFPEQSEQGRRQHNRILMGKESRPVGVMSHGEWTTTEDQTTTTEQCREIDCYSVASNVAPSAVKATYIPKPPVIGSGSPAVTVEGALGNEVLVPALEWLLAARAFGARGDANRAAICQQNAQNLLM